MTSPDEPTEARSTASSIERARRRRGASRRLAPPSPRARRFLGYLVVPMALLFAGLLTTPSYAVFNRTSSNLSDNWSAGTVALQNNSSGTNAVTGSAVFTASNLQPGNTDTRCIAVTSTGNVASAVSMYVSNVTPATAGTLPSYVSMTIEMGTGTTGTNAACTTFTPESTLKSNVHLDSLPTTFAAGATGWAPSTTATKVFRVTYTVDMTVPNTLQSSSAIATFVWEAQST
jgi:hypothetical protein